MRREKRYFMEKIPNMVKMFFLTFLFFGLNIYSVEVLTSNGEKFFHYNKNTNSIEHMNLKLDENQGEIDYIKMGFFIDGKQYEIGEDDYTLSKDKESNIINITGNVFGMKYTVSLYSSMLEKNNCVVYVKFDNYEKAREVKFYAFIKPNDMGKIVAENNIYNFNKWNFGMENTDAKLYLAENIQAKDRKLKKIPIDNFVKATEGLFVIGEIPKDKSYTYLWFGEKEYTGNIESEKDYWNKTLENKSKKELYSNIFMLKRNHLLVDVNKEISLISMEEMTEYIELLLIKKEYKEVKDIFRYFIFKGDKIQGIIPSDYLSLDGKEILRKDNYGFYDSFYRRSIFLKLYIKYLMESKDEAFYKESFAEVKTRLIDFLESKMDENGVKEDSGNGRIGADGFQRFIETQYETYKAFELLDKFYKSKNIKENKYAKISQDLKELIILYYIDDVQVADYPFSKKVNPKNIFYVDEELFFSSNDYYYALQKNIEMLKNEQNTLNEKVSFISYLYDKKYYLMAQTMTTEIENALSSDEGIEILQKDLSLLINYLIMKEKGEVNGVSK